MCLIININYHQRQQEYPRYKPFIAKKPLTVYKILNSTKGVVQTPFRGTLINFISDECIMRAPMMSHYRGGLSVEIGIHAFAKRISAQEWLKPWSYSITACNLAIYEAIIPIGTKYFYGVGGTIVSEKLIIKNKIIK